MVISPFLSPWIATFSLPEQLIIICEDKLCRNMTLSLLAKGIKSTTFLSELCDEMETFASQKLEFNRSKIAVCSDEAYQKLDLPLSDVVKRKFVTNQLSCNFSTSSSECHWNSLVSQNCSNQLRNRRKMRAAWFMSMSLWSRLTGRNSSSLFILRWKIASARFRAGWKRPTCEFRSRFCIFSIVIFWSFRSFSRYIYVQIKSIFFQNALRRGRSSSGLPE